MLHVSGEGLLVSGCRFVLSSGLCVSGMLRVVGAGLVVLVDGLMVQGADRRICGCWFTDTRLKIPGCRKNGLSVMDG